MDRGRKLHNAFMLTQAVIHCMVCFVHISMGTAHGNQVRIRFVCTLLLFATTNLRSYTDQQSMTLQHAETCTYHIWFNKTFKYSLLYSFFPPFFSQNLASYQILTTSLFTPAQQLGSLVTVEDEGQDICLP